MGLFFYEDYAGTINSTVHPGLKFTPSGHILMAEEKQFYNKYFYDGFKNTI